jgi:uncharacterized NAD(P)/FAD-binding protein YdhS
MLATSSTRPLRVAVCGGGASAVLLLAALARHGRRPLAITVFEPRPRLGRGIAYSSESPLHLLNVPAARMATSDDPEGFLRWLRAERPRADRDWQGDDFAPRALYGQYLETLCEKARAAPHLRLTRVYALAQRVLQCGDGWEVIPARGAPVRADVVVVATGNEPPAPIAPHVAAAARPLIIENPWDPRALDGLASEAAVLLVGTGLTAVDVALDLLYARGHAGPVIACSRRALLPRPHGPRAALPSELCRRLESASLRDMLLLARELASQDPSGARWRGLIDELRRSASAVWGRLSLIEKRRFLRHLRPFWEVHRHRLAPAVHARLEAAIGAGAFCTLKGRILAIEAAPSGDLLHVTLKHSGSERVLSVARVINCTGPRSGLADSTNPLLRSLRTGGLAMDDPLALGLATDADSRVSRADHHSRATLFALGALARGNRFELTAIPEIAEQARHVACAILALPQLLIVRRNAGASAVDSRLNPQNIGAQP